MGDSPSPRPQHSQHSQHCLPGETLRLAWLVFAVLCVFGLVTIRIFPSRCAAFWPPCPDSERPSSRPTVRSVRDSLSSLAPGARVTFRVTRTMGQTNSVTRWVRSWPALGEATDVEVDKALYGTTLYKANYFLREYAPGNIIFNPHLQAHVEGMMERVLAGTVDRADTPQTAGDELTSEWRGTVRDVNNRVDSTEAAVQTLIVNVCAKAKQARDFIRRETDEADGSKWAVKQQMSGEARAVTEGAEIYVDVALQRTDRTNEAVVAIEVKRDKVFDHHIGLLKRHVTEGKPPITSWDLEEPLTGWPSILFKVHRRFLSSTA